LFPKLYHHEVSNTILHLMFINYLFIVLSYLYHVINLYNYLYVHKMINISDIYNKQTYQILISKRIIDYIYYYYYYELVIF